ncbi:putative LRR receptor-like serine/threonine-protein kinase [Dorcoceras hygrometricum]|uniref:Putative LRR receptor-like serine/threonine-protein kinase n=1 Tax=Dorcoceras hygrometricum TaxID=472368 RepID=A0A2Z7BQT4_9LAMI|nr:putative LRR receptor-like serine/threonine-protein kinase [Dorcoceras hygrometricum]
MLRAQSRVSRSESRATVAHTVVMRGGVVVVHDGGARRTCVTLNGSGIHLAMGPQPLRLRNHNFGLAQRIMVKHLATSPHDPLGITDSACKNQLVVVIVQYGPFNPYIPIRSTTIGKSRVAKDPIAMHTSWRSNSDIASVTRVSMTFRVVRTNQYNQDLGLIPSTNGNHLESPNEDSLIDHQVTIYLHAQNITMFPTNETWPVHPQENHIKSPPYRGVSTGKSSVHDHRSPSAHHSSAVLNILAQICFINTLKLRPEATQVLHFYAGINYKHKVQNDKECSPKSSKEPKTESAQQERARSNFGISQLIAPSFQLVSVERASLRESNATKFVKNRGWMRWESAIKSYGEQ